MHSRFFFQLILYFTFTNAFGQVITFEKYYDTLGCYYSNCVQQNIDNGYIFCGSCFTTNSAQDAAIIRTDSLGNIIWVKEYGTPVTDGALACLITSDSDILIAGIKEEYSSTDGKLWLFKLDQNGNIIWSNAIKVLTGKNQPESIEKCKDGGYLITGSCNTPITVSTVAFLLKVDSVGNFSWSNTYGPNTEAHTCIEAMGGGYILAGAILDSNYTDVYLVKTDSIGDTLWTKKFGNSNVDGAYSIKQSPDSNIILVGNTYVSMNWNIYLVKLDQNGNFIWTKQLGDNFENTANCIQITSDGNYIIAGTTSIANSNYQALLMKLDTNGDTIWTNNFGSSQSEFGYSAVQCSDGGYVLTGMTSILPAQEAMYLVKIDSNGSLTSVNNIETDNSIILFPNPAHEYINIKYSKEEKVKVIITDLLGRPYLTTHDFNYSIATLDISSLASGIYFMNLITNKSRILKKFIKY